MAVVLNAPGADAILVSSARRHSACRALGTYRQPDQGLSSLAEKPVPVARLGGGNFDKAGDTSRVQDSIDPKGKSDVEANERS